MRNLHSLSCWRVFWLMSLSILSYTGYGQCTSPILTYDSNNSLCEGEQLNLTATINLPAGCVLAAANTFQWAGPSAPASGVSNQESIPGAASGDYTVSVAIIQDVAAGVPVCPCVGNSLPSNVVHVNQTPGVPVFSGSAIICLGASTTLTVAHNPNDAVGNPISQAGDFYWYDAAAGGNLLFVGNPYITPALMTNTTYYVTEKIGTCESQRSAVTVTMQANVDPTVAGATICAGNSTTLTAASGGTNGTFYWYSDASATQLLYVGNPFITPALSTNTSYWVKELTGTCFSNPIQSDVTVAPIADPTAANLNICAGDVAVLSAVSGGANGTFKWYADATGTQLLYTGNPFTTPNLTANTNYWVQEISGGCVSNLVQVVVSTNVVISPPVALNMTICEDDAATLNASTGGANGIFRWYDVAVGGNLLGIGNTFVTPLLTSNGNYWVEEVSGNCVSARTQVTDCNGKSKPERPYYHR